VKELVDSTPQLDPVTGLYNEVDEDHPMSELGLRLSPAKETQWEAKYNPVIKFWYAFLCHVLILYLPRPISAKYQPYAPMRHRFWRQYMKQYDTDDTNTLSRLELTSILDSLRSTLTRFTLSSFFHPLQQEGPP
jgi:phosphatidylserine decarboxylase